MYPFINKRKAFGYNTSAANYDLYKSNRSKNTNTFEVQFTETNEGYYLEFQIFGYVKEDFNCYIKNNDLVLTTGRLDAASLDTIRETNTAKHTYCYPSAYFRKTFQLPKDIEKNKIFVDYKNHILSINLFKSNVL